MKQLEAIRDRMLDASPVSPMREKLATIGKDRKRPMGKFNPWAFWVEFVRGCNIKCPFCPTVKFPEGERHFMSEQTWRDMLALINIVKPNTRIELCNAGEPTLHPDILHFLRIAREVAPHAQLMTYTNGTKLVDGSLTYKQLFDAGMNCIFVDMYHSLETHSKLAEDSGYFWFHQDDKPEGCPNIFEYKDDPDRHMIMLAENPMNWSKRKRGRGYLQTFFNDLDWEMASKIGMKPVVEAPKRRCDLPSKFVNVNFDGTYCFCCFDYMRHTAGMFGGVQDGLEGFMKFWLGEYMQNTRILVNDKERNKHPYCSKCSFTSIRCDIPWWDRELLETFWDGDQWAVSSGEVK